MKNLGIILIIIGAVAQVLCATVPAMGDLADQNFYTWGAFVLILVGLFVHIGANKKVD